MGQGESAATALGASGFSIVAPRARSPPISSSRSMSGAGRLAPSPAMAPHSTSGAAACSTSDAGHPAPSPASALHSTSGARLPVPGQRRERRDVGRGGEECWSGRSGAGRSPAARHRRRCHPARRLRRRPGREERSAAWGRRCRPQRRSRPPPSSVAPLDAAGRHRRRPLARHCCRSSARAVGK